MTFWKWSKSPGVNGGADPSCIWPEGMAPSQVNDSARGMMAALAKYRDDVAGNTVTTGSGAAYALTTNQHFDSFAHMDGAMIAFIVHETNKENPALNVDGLGARPIRAGATADIPPGALRAWSVYVVVYSNYNSAFFLHNFPVGDIPVGAGCDYWGATVPSDDFAFPVGQALSRAAYPVLFSRFGTTYGAGDGVNTFNLPDKRGRVSAGLDNMGGVNAARLSGIISSTILGGAGGAQSQALSTSHLPWHTHSGTTGSMNRNQSHSHPAWIPNIGRRGLSQHDSAGLLQVGENETVVVAATNTDHEHPFTTNGGDGVANAAHPNVQPTIVCNYIIRVR